MARADGLAQLFKQLRHNEALLIEVRAYNLAGLWRQNTPRRVGNQGKSSMVAELDARMGVFDRGL